MRSLKNIAGATLKENVARSRLMQEQEKLAYEVSRDAVMLEHAKKIGLHQKITSKAAAYEQGLEQSRNQNDYGWER